MKILVFSSLAADTGGAVRAEYLSKSLEKAGLGVDFVRPFPKTLPFKLDLLISLPWYFLRMVFSSAKFVLMVKSYPNVALPMLFKKILRKKFIIDTDDLSFAYSKGLWSRLSKIGQELFLPLADLHTYHYSTLFEYLTKDLKIPAQKTYQLKQGVDLEIFDKQFSYHDQRRLRTKWGLEGKKVLLFVGHFDIACDLEKILKMSPEVFKRISQARLLLVGDGPRKGEFEDLARSLGIFEKIVWTGLVPREEVVGFVSLSDLCLVYYRDQKASYFRSSMKLREYLSLGKKVVCNDVGELKDFAEYTYQTSSKIPDFVQMVIKVLSGFSDRREEKGRAFVRKDYSWKKIGYDLAQKLICPSKKKILFFTGVPIDDAAEIHRSGLVAKNLISKGYQVVFTSVSGNFKRKEIKTVSNLSVLFIGQAHYRTEKPFSSRQRMGVVQVLIENVKTCWRFVQILQFEKPDRILVVTSVPISLMVGLVAKILGFRILIDIDDLVAGQMQSRGYGQFLVRIYDWLERTWVKVFDRVSVCSRYLKARYPGACLMPNMIDTNFWKKAKRDPLSFRRRVGISARQRQIVFVGLIGPYQGQEKALKAFAPVLRKDKNLKLVFVGGGEKLENLKFKIKNLKLEKQIKVTGQVSQAKVKEILFNSQGGLLPLWNTPVHLSRHPLKLLEYLASGLVVVTNQVGEIGKIIKDGENGFLCPPGDINCLAEKTAAILKNPDLVKKISQKAILSASDFSCEKIFPRWLRFLDL